MKTCYYDHHKFNLCWLIDCIQILYSKMLRLSYNCYDEWMNEKWVNYQNYILHVKHQGSEQGCVLWRSHMFHTFSTDHPAMMRELVYSSWRGNLACSSPCNRQLCMRCMWAYVMAASVQFGQLLCHCFQTYISILATVQDE